jgi:uncharacterized protein (TIGR02266 family)
MMIYGRETRTMTQDTRKDRRVKIVSLNVRYKSATVDEFIENHSHDVSKGGIYIKTPNPFPPGTLLKFEIRLAGDQAVIAGVGRVVWKRDNTQANADRPAGMGVKFIKLDDSSKVVIDKLVLTKADAGKSFESEAQTEMEPLAPAAKPATPTPIGGIAKPAAASASPSGGMIRKATMMGIGAVSSSPGATPPPPATPSAPPIAPIPRDAPAPAPRPASAAPVASAPTPAPAAPSHAGANMFPATNSQGDMPAKQEQTVMKQAAELLEEALKEAGGSMDEIGSNPLFGAGSGGHLQAPPAADDGLNSTVASTPVAKASGSQPPGTRTSSSPPVGALAREAAAAAAIAKSNPENAPLTARESPSAKSIPVAEERKRSVPPARDAAVAADDSLPKKKGGAGVFIGVFVVAAAAGVGVFMFRDTIFPPTPPAPTAATSATVTTPPASASSTAAPSASVPTPPDSASAAATDAAAPKDAAPEAAATASTVAATTTAPPVPPPPTVRPPPPPTTAPPPPTTAAPPPTTAPPPPKPPPPKPPPTTDNPY